MKIKKYGMTTMFVFISILIILNGVIAQDDSVSLPGKAVDFLKCKIDFTIANINSLSSVGANLSSFSTILEADNVQLETLAISGNISAYREYVKNTLEPNFKKTREAVNQWRKDNYKNLTKEQKSSLKSSYQDAKKTFDDCHKKGLIDHGTQRVELFNKILEQYKERANKLAAKGIDTTAMNKILEDAKTQIVEPLQNGLADANDSQAIKNVLRKYCLFNGCKNGVNFHLASRFELERLKATLAYIKTKLNDTELASKITEAETNLNSAKGLLNEGGLANNNDNGRQVFNKIRTSFETLKKINKNSREVKKEKNNK
ncbi:MAG: hypothetical protein AABW75_03560 [Nanoarchaeota archaeon]